MAKITETHFPHTVLAVDPGSRKFGWAVVAARGDRAERLAGGVVRMAGDLPTRLAEILTALQGLYDAHRVDALAIESAFVHDNPRTALVLGQARGLPIALAAARGLAVHEFAPATVKRSVVGSGRADKAQVQRMVQMQLGLPELPAEDEADALAVALTYLRQRQFAAMAAPLPKALRAPEQLAMTPARLQYLQAVQQAKMHKRRA